MAIGIVAGTPVHTTGGVNLHSVDVAAPTLGANDCHVIALTASVSGAVAALPTGYTQVQGFTLSGTSSAGLQVFRRMGPASAATVTVVFPGATTVVGKMAVVPFTVTECDLTTPIELTGFDDTSLTAPSISVSSADLLVAIWGVREGVAGTTVPNAFTITAPGGLTSDGYSQTDVDNGTTQVGCRMAWKTITAGATGTQAATTTATATSNKGAVALGFNQGVVVPTVPAAPVIAVTPGDTQNVITWTAPLNGGSAITGYTLQRSTTSGSGFATINSPTAAAVSYTDTGRVNGTTYYYKLLATNGVGPSAYSAEQSGTPVAASSTGYAALVLGTSPDHYYPLSSAYQLADKGKATTKLNAVAVTGTVVIGSSTVGSTTLDAAKFTGTQMLEIPNSQDLSVTKTGTLTIMMHICIDDYDAAGKQPDRYTHPMHKAEAGQREWAIRYYDSSGLGDDPPRPRRHSAYYFAPVTPSRGPGSYAQPAGLVTGQATANMDATETSQVAPGSEHVIIAQYWTTPPTNGGGIKYFHNARATDQDTMDSGPDGPITPGWTVQNVRIGHDDLHASWVTGRVRRVAFWNRLLSQTEINTLTDPTNRALAEGTIGSVVAPTAPTPPLNVVATRSAGSSAAGTVTWTTPSSDGGSAITGYIVAYDGLSGTVTSSLLGTAVRSYDLTLLPNIPLNVRVFARNAIADSTAAATVMAPWVALPLMSGVTDNFNAGVDTRRVFSTGVSQGNGELEWATVDSTKRGSWIRADMRGQRASHLVGPSVAANTVTAMFVRSTVDPTRQVRIAYLNGALSARFDDGAPDAAPSSRAYNATADKYWQVIDSSGTVSVQTSPDGVSWVSLGHATFPTPSWFADVLVGVEAYTGTTVG